VKNGKWVGGGRGRGSSEGDFLNRRPGVGWGDQKRTPDPDERDVGDPGFLPLALLEEREKRQSTKMGGRRV